MGTLDDHTLIRPTQVRYGVLAFACTLSLITYLDRVCIMRANQDIQNDLGFTTRQMGLVFSAFLLGYTLFEVPGGWMGDKWGSRRTLTRIVLCWSLFTALTGCVFYFSPIDSGRALIFGPWYLPLVFDAFALMLLVRFLFGMGEAGAYPNLTRVVRDWFPARERAFAQGNIWMCARFGGAIAPVVIGRLTSVIGWRLAFGVLGVIGVTWAVCFIRWFRSHPDKHPGCNESECRLIREGQPRRTDHDSGHSWPGLGLLAGSLSIWAMGFAAFWVCFGWYFYPTWQPKYLEDVHQYRPDGWESELLTGLPFLCGAVGCLIGGGISDRLVQRLGHRWGRSLIGLVGFLGAGVCVLATGFAVNAFQAVALLCLAFLVNDLAIPVLWAVAADVGGRFAGTVSGLMNMVGGIGAIITPALIPDVRERLLVRFSPEESWRIIFAGLAGAWFLAAAAWLFIDASKRLAQGPPPAPPIDPENGLPLAGTIGGAPCVQDGVSLERMKDEG
jgi:MFS transporter, ACS family, glucarate transporter